MCSLIWQFDMTFPALACSILSVDAMDISGELHLDVVCDIFLYICLSILWLIWFFFFFPLDKQKHDVIKRRLDSHGNIIESRQDGIGAAKVCFSLV